MYTLIRLVAVTSNIRNNSINCVKGCNCSNHQFLKHRRTCGTTCRINTYRLYPLCPVWAKHEHKGMIRKFFALLSNNIFSYSGNQSNFIFCLENFTAFFISSQTRDPLLKNLGFPCKFFPIESMENWFRPNFPGIPLINLLRVSGCGRGSKPCRKWSYTFGLLILKIRHSNSLLAW